MSSGVPPQKLVTLVGPSVGLNGEGVLFRTSLTRNPYIRNGASNEDMVGMVKEGDKHVVFNCHGFSAKPPYKAYIAIGQMLFEDNVEVCFPWMRINSLRVIWLSACNIGGSGLGFCKKLAKITGCYVVTNTGPALDRSLKPNTIEDNYAAMPQYVKPDGGMISRADFKALGGKYGFTIPG
ncbi:hypothetical protein AB4Z10_05035 [Bosea sp. RAF48]|uniref:hypothetical protein n=1 Tax=Bosea sp. RAF48 TaxID=3237480 RepID=UPI003F8FF8AE